MRTDAKLHKRESHKSWKVLESPVKTCKVTPGLNGDLTCVMRLSCGISLRAEAVFVELLLAISSANPGGGQDPPTCGDPSERIEAGFSPLSKQQQIRTSSLPPERVHPVST